MPYFKNDKINLLFIHIPKTGGSSLDFYFSEKYNIPLNTKSLYTNPNEVLSTGIVSQHLTFSLIKANAHQFDVDFNGITIISIVRNPYERLISGFFYLKWIDKNTTCDDVYLVLKEKSKYFPPQYLFLVDDNNKINENIIILKTETLDTDMKKLGYTDFNLRMNTTNMNVNYYSYLNATAIMMINMVYENDFKYFNYPIIVFNKEI